MILKTYDHKKKTQVVAGEYDLVTCTFTKKVKPAHYMIKEHGYGISEELIENLKNLGCLFIKVVSKTKTITVHFSDVLQLPIKEYGHGEQRFIKA